MIYRNHNPMDVLKSPHYMKHASAMTKEELHDKADIAEELAWRDMQIEQLRAELTAEREKVAQLEAKRAADNAQYSADEIEWNEQLAAAQAVIEQMREALESCTPADYTTSHVIHSSFDDALVEQALALPTNLDALHEARALECERLKVICEEGFSEFLPNSGGQYALKCMSDILSKEAEAHRAKKGT